LSPDRRRRSWLLAAGLPLILGVLLAGVALAAASCGTAATIARGPAPDFSGTTIEGVSVSPSEYRGKPLVLAFMASW
jgi:hypothetical protein